MTTFTVEGMTCGGCRSRVEAALQVVAPSSTVTLAPPRATVPGTHDMAELNAVLSALGNYRLLAVADDAGAANIDAAVAASPETTQSWLNVYYPLLLITAYIVVASFAGVFWTDNHHASRLDIWMMNFMAGFFLVFSFFKLLDLKGFASVYATYDVVAKRWGTWGYIYPFIELGLGMAFLFRVAPVASNLIVLVVMSISIMGVIQALAKRQTIRCACLGTVLNLPMSTVTLVEDGLMIAMSAAMLAMMLR